MRRELGEFGEALTRHLMGAARIVVLVRWGGEGRLEVGAGEIESLHALVHQPAVDERRRIVTIERNRGIIAIVGAGISDAGGAMGRALMALGDVRIQMMSLSATGINLTVIVDASTVKPAMQRLHKEFFGNQVK